MKKLIALALVLTMALPFAAQAGDVAVGEPVYEKGAEGTVSKTELEKVLLDVKSKVDIPAELTEFNYYVYGVDPYYFNLYWSNKDGSKNATVYYSAGTVMSYYSYSDSSFKKFLSLADLTRAQGEEKARAFAARIVKDEADYRCSDVSVSDGQYSYVFQLFKNNILVYGASYHATVDYVTGAVISFNQSPAATGEYAHLPSAATVDAAAAQEILKQAQKTTLSYYINYDYQNGTAKTFPAYSVYYSASSVVDAVTGKILKTSPGEDPGYGGGAGGPSSAKEMASDAAGGNRLTEKERAAIEEYEGLLTAEQVAALLTSQLPDQFGADLKLASQNLDRNYYDKDEIFWNLYFEQPSEDGERNNSKGAYASVNAKTGEILSFSVYDYRDDGSYDKQYTPDRQKQIDAANALIAKLVSDKSLKFELSEGYDPGTYRESYLYFARIENGIPVNGNGISISYDNRTDTIRSYNKYCTKASFEKFTPAGEAAVLDAYAKQNPVGLCYFYVDGAYKLVYMPIEYGCTLYSGVGAKPINYDGGDYTPYKYSDIAYGDVEGHFAQKQIEALANIGVGFSGGSYRPDEAITEKELVNLLLQVKRSYYVPYYDTFDTASVNGVYDAAKRIGIIAKDEETYPDSPATRERAAILIVRLMGYDEVAALKDTYIQPFADVTPDMQGYGAIALIKGFKIVGGDAGNFYPAKQLTRGEAAVMICNLLKNA